MLHDDARRELKPRQSGSGKSEKMVLFEHSEGGCLISTPLWNLTRSTHIEQSARARLAKEDGLCQQLQPNVGATGLQGCGARQRSLVAAPKRARCSERFQSPQPSQLLPRP